MANALINGSCSGSVIHPGLFEIIFTSRILPVAQRQSSLPIPLVTFKESSGKGSEIQAMLEKSEFSERNTEARASHSQLLKYVRSAFSKRQLQLNMGFILF